MRKTELVNFLIELLLGFDIAGKVGQMLMDR